MSLLQKLEEEIGSIPSPRKYVIESATRIVGQYQFAEDDRAAAGFIAEYSKRCESLLRSFQYEGLLAEVTKLDQALRNLSIRRPDEAALTAARESLVRRAGAAGWCGEECVMLLHAAPNPADVAEITWREVRFRDGSTIDRFTVRSFLRTAAYSADGWQKYLSTLPPIEAPRQ